MKNLKCDFDIVGAKVLAFPPNDMPNGVEIKDQDMYVKYPNLSAFKESMAAYTDFKHEDNSSMKIDSRDWSGCETWESYLKILDNGDEKVLNKIKEQAQKDIKDLEDKYLHKIQKYKLDVSGDIFDIGMVLENVPECWIKQIDQDDEKRSIEINANIVGSCYVKQEDFVNGAARIISIANVLEKSDIAVKVNVMVCTIGMNSYDRDQKLIVSCALKDYSEPIDYNKCASLINPSFLRRGNFKLFEYIMKDKLSCGYGRPYRDREGMVDITDRDSIDEFEKEIFGFLEDK